MEKITQYDLDLLSQRAIHFCVKIEILDESGRIINVLCGTVIGGSGSINSESDIRRTFSLTVVPTRRIRIKFEENNIFWLDKTLKLYFGVKDMRTGLYKYYKQGFFIITSPQITYDAITNQLQLECSDFMTYLDGTKNGQVGALTTLIPAYEENPDTGEVIKYNIIRDAVIQIIKQLTNVKRYWIDDIGEYKALQQNNEDWQKYRQEHEQWNAIPYDLEFESGCTVLSILKEFRDLYPNYELFFDQNNVLTLKLIPSCYKDEILIDDSFLQKMLVSENVSVDPNTIRNICEVWGKVIEADFFAETSTLSGATYNCNIEGYDEYYNGDIIAINISSVSPDKVKLKVNGLAEVDIYDENLDKPLEKGYISEVSTYCFKIKKIRIDKQTIMRAYLLGEWQPHAVDVLSDGNVSKELYTHTDGKKYKKFSKEYFQAVYNCKNVNITIVKESPYSVQKLGEILDVKSGGEFENITSDSLALSRAKYENWKNCRLTDCISITTVLIPFLDVNIKVSYRRNDLSEKHQYIIKSISHDFGSFTSTITMYRFYPLYEELLKEAGTHKALSYYKHGVLGKYTFEEFFNLIGGEDY